jgi:hypothetical protein
MDEYSHSTSLNNTSKLNHNKLSTIDNIFKTMTPINN